MRTAIVTALNDRCGAFNDLLASVSSEELNLRPDVPGHKTISEHLWCLIGARESYAKGIRQGEWAGFGCSLQSFEYNDFVKALSSSANQLLLSIDEVSEWTESREQLLLAVAEHEVMHEGQLIRHFRAVDKPIPETVRWA